MALRWLESTVLQASHDRLYARSHEPSRRWSQMLPPLMAPESTYSSSFHRPWPLGHRGCLHWGTCSPGKESDELLGKTLQILQDKLVETTETTSIFRQRLSIDIHRPFGFWGFIVLFDITSKESTDKALQIIEDWRHLETSRVCLGSDVALFNDSLWQR